MQRCALSWGVRAKPEAIDKQGLPYEREALTVGELPSQQVRHALDSAKPALEAAVGLPVVAQIKFGVPLHNAFGMTRAQAKNHPQRDLVLKNGFELSLDLCAAFAKPAA